MSKKKGVLPPRSQANLPLWERGVNEEQREVVMHTLGPICVLAQAGSGKTFSLCLRIARLIADGVDPRRILAVTFSTKAAGEMNERLKLFGVDGCRVGTWHSLCLQILKESGKLQSRAVDEKDKAKTILKQLLGYRGMDWKGADLQAIRSYIGVCKANLWAPGSEEAMELARKRFSYQAARADEAHKRYDLEVYEAMILPFDDFLVDVADLFREDEHTRSDWASRYDHVLQDECFDGDTPVLLDKGGGQITIREMVEGRYAGSVVAYDPSTNKSVLRRVVGHHKIPLEKRMVRVVVRRRGFLESGERMSPMTERVRFRTHYLLCTEDHRVWTSAGWKEAGTLRPGDELVVESCASQVASFMNGAKISVAGKAKLARLMRRKNRAGACGRSRTGNLRGPRVRGGNGRGPSAHEAALLARLGSGWEWGYVVRTGNGRPRFYAIDVANPELMIAVEVDGPSHHGRQRQVIDARKQQCLEAMGWVVVRIRNTELPALTRELLEERVYNSPCPAEVISIDDWRPRDPYVYDIDVEGLHNFHADGIVVHNCQDENGAQDFIATCLARDHRNYMVVGDSAQSIYGFRGSSPAFIMRFADEWPGAKVVVMSRNYRSGDSIVEAANNVIRPAEVRVPADMVAMRGVPGKVEVKVGETLDDEANNFVAWVRELTDGGSSLSTITCLFRTNAQSRALEEALLGARVPYLIVGGLSFYERKEVRDLLAYLRVAAGTGAVGDVKRCINAPFRFLGAKFVERVMREVGFEDGNESDGIRAGIDWTRTVFDVAQGEGIQRRQIDSACAWGRIVHGIGEKIAKGGDDARPGNILAEIVRSTGYIEWITKEEGEDSIETSGGANVREMIRVAEKFPTVQELLAYVDETVAASRRQRNDKQAGGDRVTLMSIHRSKGLEWPHVWVNGLNENVLPHARGDAEEERRLAYVAMTRARDALVLSYVRRIVTKLGVKDAEPSRYIADSGALRSSSPWGDEDEPDLVGVTAPPSVELHELPTLS